MTKPDSFTQPPDTETAAIVERFERLHAALGTPEEAEPEETPPPAEALFAHESFELPGQPADTSDSGAELAPAEPPLAREPYDSHSAAAVDTAEDIEDAIAILRGQESRLPFRAVAESQKPQEDAVAVAPPSRVPSMRRYAVPAIAAMIFVTLATGYVVMRHGDEPAASSVPSSPLRLDYDLAQTKAGETVAARKTR